MTTQWHRMGREITQGFDFGGPATLEVESAGHRNEYGEWVAGTTTATVKMLGSTPLSGVERDLLPEAARIADARNFWVASPVAPVRVGAGPTDGDIIRYEGAAYRAIRVDVWQGCWHIIGVRRDDD